MLDLTKFTTEQRNQRSMDLDTMTSLQIVIRATGISGMTAKK